MGNPIKFFKTRSGVYVNVAMIAWIEPVPYSRWKEVRSLYTVEEFRDAGFMVRRSDVWHSCPAEIAYDICLKDRNCVMNVDKRQSGYFELQAGEHEHLCNEYITYDNDNTLGYRVTDKNEMCFVPESMWDATLAWEVHLNTPFASSHKKLDISNADGELLTRMLDEHRGQ